MSNEEVPLSSSMQDYLEKILTLQENNEIVRITDIANAFKIAKASVNQTIGKLKQLGYVTQQSYGPVMLTEKGKQLATLIQIKHFKLRRFLVEVLHVDPAVAEEDACKMEHAVSPQTMAKLTEFLCGKVCLQSGCDMSCHDENISKGKKQKII